MIAAVLLLAMSQIHSTVTLEPVPPCVTCDALMARVAALETRLAAAPDALPVRRVRLIEVSQPVRTVTYTVPTAIRYPQVFTDWAPGSYVVPAATYMSPGASFTTTSIRMRPGLFGGRFAASSFSVCGPNGCP